MCAGKDEYEGGVPLTFEQYKSLTDNPDVNENYIWPEQFMFQLQKRVDEYAGGASTMFITNKPSLERALELLDFLKEDSEKLAAENSHELMYRVR